MEEKTYAGVIVKHSNKFLLCKRNLKDSYPNTWSIPGGKVEGDEKTKMAAVREFFEETDIKINEDDLKFVGVIPRKQNKKLSGVMYLYFLEVKSRIYPDLENAVDGYEHSECGYFSLEEISELNYDEELFKFLHFFEKK